MNLLDIIGPVMVGPSSSHTAGAVKIRRVSHVSCFCGKEVKAKYIFVPSLQRERDMARMSADRRTFWACR